MHRVVTNATGSLNPAIPVGTIVVIQDHLSLPSLTGMNPVLGPNYPPYPRFLPMSDAYSRRLRKLVFHAFYKLCNSPLAAKHSLTATSMTESDGTSAAIKEGTYAYVSGPTYETPAEGRFLRNAGADVVGMSTIPEVIVAREEGLEVCIISLVTNFVVIPEGYLSVREEVEAEVSRLSIIIILPPMVPCSPSNDVRIVISDNSDSSRVKLALALRKL